MVHVSRYTLRDGSLIWQQVTLAYFCVTGLDLLGKLSICSKAHRDAVKNWVLAQQVQAVGDSGLLLCLLAVSVDPAHSCGVAVISPRTMVGGALT